MFEFARWLGATPLSVAIQSSTWLTPLVQAIHILTIGVVFVSMLMIALRVLGLARTDEAFESTWQRFMPWMWRGLLVMAITGATLIIGEPLRQARALSFWLKMGLLLVAVLAVTTLRPAVAEPSPQEFAAGKRLAAVVIVALWVTIIFLGRAIAYDPEVWGSWSLGGAA